LNYYFLGNDIDSRHAKIWKADVSNSGKYDGPVSLRTSAIEAGDSSDISALDRNEGKTFCSSIFFLK